MDTVARAAFIYLFLFVIFRLAGKRSLAQTTPFELILLLIISEVTQQAMVGNDYSLTTGAILIVTLVGLDILLMQLKTRVPSLDRYLEDRPLVIVEDGRPRLDLMRRAEVDEEDVLQAARERLGLERMEQIKYAVLETSGEISIIPKA